MAIKYDPVEETEEFRTAMKKIKPILDKEFPRKNQEAQASFHLD